MKLKITIWIEDKETIELSEEDKLEFKEQIREDLRFYNPNSEIKLITIEETEYED